MKCLLGKYDSVDDTWIVELCRNNGAMDCSCMKLELKGLPCRHMFRVMVLGKMKQIPGACILPR